MPYITQYYDDCYMDGWGQTHYVTRKNDNYSGSFSDLEKVLEYYKDTKPYVPDEEVDEEFNAEMEKRFTDLMNRARGNKHGLP